MVACAFAAVDILQARRCAAAAELQPVVAERIAGHAEANFAGLVGARWWAAVIKAVATVHVVAAGRALVHAAEDDAVGADIIVGAYWQILLVHDVLLTERRNRLDAAGRSELALVVLGAGGPTGLGESAVATERLDLVKAQLWLVGPAVARGGGCLVGHIGDGRRAAAGHWHGARHGRSGGGEGHEQGG